MKSGKPVQPAKLAGKLLEIRRHLRLSQSQMARVVAPGEDASIYRARISQYERGRRIPAHPQILAYARSVKVAVEVLIDEEMELIL